MKALQVANCLEKLRKYDFWRVVLMTLGLGFYFGFLEASESWGRGGGRDSFGEAANSNAQPQAPVRTDQYIPHKMGEEILGRRGNALLQKEQLKEMSKNRPVPPPPITKEQKADLKKAENFLKNQSIDPKTLNQPPSNQLPPNPKAAGGGAQRSQPPRRQPPPPPKGRK